MEARVPLFILLFLFVNILSAQDPNIENSAWLSFEKKMQHFSALGDADFEKYRTDKKDDWKRAFVIEESFTLFPTTNFLYGYNNAKQEYISCTINDFNQRTGSLNWEQANEDVSRIENILKEILDKDYQSYDASSIRQECVFCSDSTLVLWKNSAEDGSKFLEKKYVTLKYFKTFSQLEITFYNNRRIIDGFFEEAKKEVAPTPHTISLKENDANQATTSWATANNATAETQLLHSFLLLMKTETSDSPILQAKVSPAFLTAHKKEGQALRINGFSNYGGFKIAESSGNKISAYIWGKNRNWTHKVTIDVVEENGSLYLHPLEVNEEGYIMPWLEIERFVKVGFVE